MNIWFLSELFLVKRLVRIDQLSDHFAYCRSDVSVINRNNYKKEKIVRKLINLKFFFYRLNYLCWAPYLMLANSFSLLASLTHLEYSLNNLRKIKIKISRIISWIGAKRNFFTMKVSDRGLIWLDTYPVINLAFSLDTWQTFLSRWAVYFCSKIDWTPRMSSKKPCSIGHFVYFVCYTRPVLPSCKRVMYSSKKLKILF